MILSTEKLTPITPLITSLLADILIHIHTSLKYFIIVLEISEQVKRKRKRHEILYTTISALFRSAQTIHPPFNLSLNNAA